MRLKFQICSSLIALNIFAGSAFATATFDFSAGYYNINAKTSSGEANIANPGVMKVSYHLNITPSIDFRPGYSLYVMKTKDSSDIGYGLDLTLIWYFLSQQPYAYIQNDNLQWKFKESFRPYVGLGFNQRQYQSIQSSYAGIGLTAGAEFSVDSLLPYSMYLFSEMQYLSLSGPLSSMIKEFQMLFGSGYHF